MVKDIFLHNGGQRNTSHVQTAQDIFQFIERTSPKLSCVKIWQHLAH